MFDEGTDLIYEGITTSAVINWFIIISRTAKELT
jgi:hypothetical protein